MLEVMMAEWINLRPKENSLLMFVFEITDYSTTFAFQYRDWPGKACRLTKYPISGNNSTCECGQ